jgi:hypothetical protein
MAEENSSKPGFSVRRLFDFFMGAIYLGLAFVFAFAEKFHLQFALLQDKQLRYAFAGLIAFYGLWRLYRGFRKN